MSTEARIVVVQTEPRCKCCGAGPEVRARIDALLLKRHLKVRDETTGKVWSWPLVQEALALLGVGPIALPSLRRHQDGHCRIIEAGETEEAAEESPALEDEEQRETLEAILRGDADEGDVLRLIVNSYGRETARRILAGERVTVTADQATRAATALNARREQGAQAALLAALGGGIERVFTKALAEPDAPREIEQPDVIDQEPVEVEAEEVSA